MRNKKKAEIPASRSSESLEIQTGNDGLAGAGRCDHKVSMAVVTKPLEGYPIKDFLLKWIGLNVQSEENRRALVAFASSKSNGSIEPCPVALRVVALEIGTRPVRVEYAFELLNDPRGLNLRNANVPFQPVEERRAGKIRRPDVSGGKARVAVEKPRFRMKARAPGFIRNSHLGAHVAKCFDRLSLGRPDVGRCNHAQRAPEFPKLAKRRFEQTKAVPLDKCAKKIDPICRRDLFVQQRSDSRLPLRIDQEVSADERDGRSNDGLACCQIPNLRRQRSQLLCWLDNRSFLMTCEKLQD